MDDNILLNMKINAGPSTRHNYGPAHHSHLSTLDHLHYNRLNAAHAGSTPAGAGITRTAALRALTAAPTNFSWRQRQRSSMRFRGTFTRTPAPATPAKLHTTANDTAPARPSAAALQRRAGRTCSGFPHPAGIRCVAGARTTCVPVGRRLTTAGQLHLNWFGFFVGFV